MNDDLKTLHAAGIRPETLPPNVWLAKAGMTERQMLTMPVGSADRERAKRAVDLFVAAAAEAEAHEIAMDSVWRKMRSASDR